MSWQRGRLGAWPPKANDPSYPREEMQRMQQRQLGEEQANESIDRAQWGKRGTTLEHHIERAEANAEAAAETMDASTHNDTTANVQPVADAEALQNPDFSGLALGFASLGLIVYFMFKQ